MGHISRNLTPDLFLHNVVENITEASDAKLFTAMEGRILTMFYAGFRFHGLEEFDGGRFYVATRAMSKNERPGFITFTKFAHQKDARKNPLSEPKPKSGYQSLTLDVISKIKEKMLVRPSDAVELLRYVEEKEDFLQNNKEHMWAIGLNTRNRVIYLDLISLGTVNYNLVHPRESFRRAVIEGVAGLIFAHNHPSETLEFSDEDLSLVKRLQQCGKLLGIEVLDFVVYAEGRLLSARQKNLM